MLHRPRNIMRTVAFSVCLSSDRPCFRSGRGSDRRLAGGRRRRQHPGCRMQWQHVGRGGMGEDAGRPRQEQSRCLETEQADLGNADPDRHEEEACRRSMGRPSLQRQGRPDVRDDDQAGRHRSDGDSRLRARLPLRRRDLDPRLGPDPLKPGQQHGQGRAEGHGALPKTAAQQPTTARRCAEDHRRRQPGCPNPLRSRRPASPATSAISVYSPTSRGLPISAGWNSSTAASVVTSESASSLPMLAVPG